jgi:hypothetical protein
MAEHGSDFERMAEIRGADDENTRKLAAENIAQTLAERNTAPGRMEFEDYSRVAEAAVGKAYQTEEQQRLAPQQAEGLEVAEPPTNPPDKPTGHLMESATPVSGPEQDPLPLLAPPQGHLIEPATPISDPEHDAPAVQAQDPDVQPAANYMDMKREQAEIVAGLDVPEPAHPASIEIGEEGIDAAENIDLAIDRSEARSPEAEQALPGEKKLSFFEDREPERSRDRGHEVEQTDAKQSVRQDTGEKTLEFDEDRNPAMGQDLER